MDLAQLMAFAGRSEALTGTLTSHLSYASEGATSEALLANMEVQGTVRLDGGSYAGLGLAEALDAAADRLDNIDVEVAIAGLDQPVKASGGLDWRGERFALSATASPAAMLAGKPMPVQASLSGNRLSAGVTGTAAPDGAFDGRVSVRTPDLRGLLAWVGRPLGPGGGLGPFSVSGRFNATPDGLSFEETDVSLDGTSGRGEGSIQLSGAVPVIKASFALEQIALDPYLGQTARRQGRVAMPPLPPLSRRQPVGARSRSISPD
ncbi:hypothetical protein D1F64_21560 [Breoghania sp. L-A4]|nr:hypothetical protein D1F64_21560 [Breoghania sp. L-A4]